MWVVLLNLNLQDIATNSLRKGLIEYDQRRGWRGPIINKKISKGDVFQIARLAGIMASKQTSSIIPLCHPLIIDKVAVEILPDKVNSCLLYTSPSPRDLSTSRMPSSA